MKPLAIVLNIVLPGLGTLVIGKIPGAIAQWMLWAMGLFLSFTFIGAIIGFPLIAIAWIWALITAVKYQEPGEVKRGVQYTSGSGIRS